MIDRLDRSSPNQPVPLSRQPPIRPLNSIPLSNFPDDPRWPPANNTPTRYYHTRGNNRPIQHNREILQYRHPSNYSLLPDMHMITDTSRLDDRALTHKHMVSNLQWIV